MTAASQSDRVPPATGVIDVLRLAGGIVAEVVRHPRTFSLGASFRRWARDAAARRSVENLILNFGVKRVLLVGGTDLSAGILRPDPRRDGLAAGELKRGGMSFLAPRALTISDDDDWRRRRVLNEQVLAVDRRELRHAVVGSVIAAFNGPIRDVEDIRAAMARTMLAVVFGGGQASPELAADVQALFALVQNPLKRALIAPWAKRRRRRFYATLRRLWRDPANLGSPSLFGIAHRLDAGMDEMELLEQVPHWMFTFTGSGTDLLARTLALVLSDADAQVHARTEVAEAGAIEDPATVERLAYLRACLLETAQLYPPVTRTFHHAARGITIGKVVIPPGMEIMHAFPLIGEHAERPRRFRPERWLGSGAVTAGFDPFLGGARRCPGRDVILLVGTVALALLVGRHRLVVDGAGLRADALPEELPTRGLAFRIA